MLAFHEPIAIFMEASFGDTHGKMCYDLLRFSTNPIVAIIDSTKTGKTIAQVMPNLPQGNIPIVADVDAAAALGAKAIVIGMAPSGGRLPAEWFPHLDRAVEIGLSLVNGLHAKLADRYTNLKPNQWIWDVRQEPANLGVGKGRARELKNKRMLIVGTDMANGKMTAGLKVLDVALKRGIKADFLATGQIGIVLRGKGIPLDAIKLDYACGAVEQGVMELADNELIIIEGQGSLLHPGSTANLPLLRGACPTHLLLNHKAGAKTLRDFPWMKFPPFKAVAKLYEDLASSCGTLPAAKVYAIALNTSTLTEQQAIDEIKRTEDETGLPTNDPVRFDAENLVP
ncbi:MAG: DUF1611 domain-containing protein [Lentisphaerae bacterium]|jgi:uncharacterized NAD-dependent epimerase/dehydratase family protein|nr:DUF1611 domain-containing protein [Lentisphaerota bacterium]